MQSILDQTNLDLLAVEYADLRIEQTIESSVVIKNGELLEVQELPTLGAFLRIYHHGRWFEASTTKLDNLIAQFEELIELAKSSNLKQTRPLPKRKAEHHIFESYKKNNCMQATLEEKTALCHEVAKIASLYKEIVSWRVMYTDRYKQKWFKAKDGVSFFSDYNHAGVNLGYSLKREEKRFDDRASAWFMNIHGQLDGINKKFRAEIEESLLFLDAAPVEAGKYQVLLSPEVTGVFTHESFGHKSEADFMLGDETMLKEWTIGKKVAADIVSIVDEGDSINTSGYCPIDDEGNRKQKTYLIKDGKLAGRLHSSTTAIQLGEENTGNARAMNFEFGPIVRMTNTYIESGTKPRSEVIANVKNGIFIKDFKHGMGMSTFTIAPGKSYLIENGKITKPVKVSVISGTVFETLMNITAIANDFDVKSSAFGGCGKFEQAPLPVADGGPSILVDGMQVS